MVERDILHTVERRMANWIGHTWRRSCVLKHTVEGNIEGGIEMMGGRERRRKQLLDDLKERRGYWKLKEEALHCNVWRIGFERGNGLVVKQTAE